MAETAKKETKSNSTSGVAIASLVIGIVAFFTGWIAIWGVLVGIAAIVLGIIALKKSAANKGFGITGIVLGGIAALTSIVFTIIWVLAFTFVAVGSGSALNVVKTANDALNAQNAEVKAQISAKKDFSKGETAKFGDFDVKVLSSTRGYTMADSYTQASDGNEFVRVGVSVKNTTDTSQSFTKYSLKLIAGSVSNDASFVATADPEFTGGDIVPGGTAEGNIVFEVKKDSTGLKLQYETTVYDLQTYKSVTLVYTLEI